MSTRHRTQEKAASAPVDFPTRLTWLRPAATVAAYLVPPAIAAASACFVIFSGARLFQPPLTRLTIGYGIVLVGLAAGALAGRAASVSERLAVTRAYEQRLDDLDHDLRTPMTIIRGEVELVLSQENIPAAERTRSSAAILEQLGTLELRLRRRYQP